MSVYLRSRLAQRLDGEIAAMASNPARCAVLQVQRAILWLRHGREAEARKELDRLHASILVHPRVELAAWLHLAEGLVAYFGAAGGDGRDRVRRAGIMAAAAGLTSLQAQTGAWQAQMSYAGRDIYSLIHHAQATLALLQSTDHAAAYRVATALASAWSLAGGETATATWYAWARQHAIAEGDDASLAALLYNQAQVRALQFRRAALAGQPSEAPAARLGIESIAHYDGAVGGSARSNLTPLLDAQLLVVQGDFAEAALLLEAHIPAALAAGLNSVGCSLLGDLALCWTHTGEALRARALADHAATEVLAEDQPDCDIDDRAVLHSRLAQVYARLHEDELAARQADAATAAWAIYAAQRRHWAERLTAAGLVTPPR